MTSAIWDPPPSLAPCLCKASKMASRPRQPLKAITPCFPTLTCWRRTSPFPLFSRSPTKCLDMEAQNLILVLRYQAHFLWRANRSESPLKMYCWYSVTLNGNGQGIKRLSEAVVSPAYFAVKCQEGTSFKMNVTLFWIPGWQDIWDTQQKCQGQLYIKVLYKPYEDNFDEILSCPDTYFPLRLGNRLVHLSMSCIGERKSSIFLAG